MNYFKNWSEFEAYQERTNWSYFNSKNFSSSDLMSIAIKHFMLRQLHWKYFIIEKDQNLDFDSNCWWGALRRFTLSPASMISRTRGVLQLYSEFEGIWRVEISNLLKYLRWNKLLHFFGISLVSPNSEALAKFLRFFSREMRRFNCLKGGSPKMLTHCW